MWRKGLLVSLILSFSFSLTWAASGNAVSDDQTPLGQVKTKLEKNLTLTRAEKQLAERNGLLEIAPSAPVRPSVRDVATVYLSEGFETWPPAGWTLDPATGTGAWLQGTGTTHGPGNVVEGTYAAYFNDYDYSSGTMGTMATPVIDLTSATAPRLVFYYWDGSGADAVVVEVSTDGTTFTGVYAAPGTVSSWTETVVDLTSYAGNATVYVQFRGTSVWGTTNPHIDMVSVEEAPTVPVLSLSASTLTFANQPVGTWDDKNLTISNTGGSVLNISDISTVDGSFTVSSSALTVDPTGSATVVVTFSPLDETAHAASLVITSDAASSPDTVALNGTGIAAPTITAGGPDTGGYSWVSSFDAGGPTFSWIDSTGSTNAGIANGDDFRGTIPLPFLFRFDGAVYSAITGTTNGWIGMGPSSNYTSSYYNNATIPTASNPNNVIAPYWDDLKAGGTYHGTMVYKTVGTAPNRQFVVIWQDVYRTGAAAGDYYTFEVILHETTCDITFQYLDATIGNASWNNGLSATVGTENSTGTDGLLVGYNGTPQGVYGGEVIHFTAPAAPAEAIVQLSTYTHDFGSTYTGNTSSFDVTITNTGGADLVVAGATVNAPFSTTYSGTIAPLSADVMTIDFTPTVAGTYSEILALNITGTYTGVDTVALAGTGYDVVAGLAEGFEGGTFPPTNWSVTTTDASGDAWEAANNGTTHGPGSVAEGLLAAMADIYNMSSGTSSHLYTPVVDLTGFTAPQLNFWWQCMTGSAPVPNLTINISTDGGATWSEIYNQDADGTANAWVNIVLPLTGLTATTQFDFVAFSDYGSYNLFLDNVVVEEQPTLPINTLFFSEYMEGSSNNKALEIYNGTDSIAHLNEYQIFQSNNGGGWAYYHLFPDTAVLAPGDVWVMVTDTWFPAEAAVVADEILSYPDLVFFNGNDARALVHIVGADTLLIDVFGVPTESANWTVAGVAGASAEHTLVRKAYVTGGNYGDWALSAGIDAESSEYVVLPQNAHQFFGAWPVLDFTEPNDNLATAVAIASGDTVMAAIDPDGDLDFFTFTLTEDSEVTIDMLIAGYSSLDSKIRLMNSDSVSIASADVGFSGGDEQIVQILGAGTYYIVAGYWGDVLRSSTGAYAMALNAVPYTVQPGEDCAHAIDYGIPNDATQAGTTVSGQVVWYSFNTDGSFDNVTVSLCGSDFDTKLYVYDACDATTYIAYNDDACGLQSEVSIDGLAAGTYYVKVMGYGSSFGNYVLNVIGITGQPDFVVSSMTMSGDTLNVDVTNQGAADSPGYFGTDYHGLFIDGNYMGYVYESGVALAAGASQTYTLTGFNYDNLGAGDHGILFACDVDNDVVESDELNNTDSITITIAVPPAAPRNLMATAGEGSVDLTWDPAPEESLPTAPTIQINGATDVKTKNVTDSPEAIEKWARIDADLRANRDAQILGDDCTDPFIVTALPFNETGSTAGFTNSFAYGAGSDVVYQVTVAADGYLTASTCGGTIGDTKLQIFAADCATSLATNDDFCGLRSQITIQVTAGDYMVVVDGYSAGSLGYTVDISYAATLPTPDLAVTDIWYDGYAVWAEVSNIGTLSANSEPAHWFMNGTDVGYVYTPALAVGAVDTIGLTGLVYANVGPGDFTVSVQVDFYDYLAELDETNNEGTIVVTIAEPDYVPTYNVYRDGVEIASDVPPVDFAFSGGFIDVDMPALDVEYCYTVTQILPDSSESASSNVACATPWAPPFADFPFAQDFEALTVGGPFPTGWFVEELGTPDGVNWEVGDSIYFSGNLYNYWHVQNHTQFAGIDDDGWGSGVNGNEILWLPWIDLTGTVAPRILFAYSAQGGTGSELIVQPMEGDPATYPLINNSGAWDGAQFDLSMFIGQTIKVGFHYDDGGSWAYGLGVDDILINEAPAPGTIAGTVTDGDGNILGLANIEATNEFFTMGTQTDVNGNYSIGIPPGVYDVHAWALNHEPGFAQGVVVESGATATVDFSLNLHLPAPYGLHRAMTEPGDVTLEWGPPLPMGMLASDDGTFETFYWVSGPTTTAQFFAQHFHSPLPPGYSVNQIAVLATADAPRQNFEKFVVVGSDSNGMPDMSAVLWNASTIQAAEYPNVRWEVRNVNVTPASPDFWVLVEWPAGNTMGPYIATDTDGMPGFSSFWTSDSGATWNSIPYNFFIRAFVGMTTPTREQGSLASATVEATKLTTRRAFNVKEDIAPSVGHNEAPGIYDVSRELQSFNVYRTTDLATWGEAYANVPGTTFTDLDFAFDTDYWYQVTAVYTEGESGPSNVVPVYEWTPLELSYFEHFDYDDNTPFDTTGWVADDGNDGTGNWNIESMMAHFDWSPSQVDSFAHTLTSPVVADLTDATVVRLRFYQFFDDYDDSDNGQFNMKVSISNDGFATETVVWAHNDSIFGNIDSEMAFDLSDFAAGMANMQLRFTAWGAGTFTMDNWWIDDVMIETDLFPNQPPAVFNMLTPANGDSVYITDANYMTDFLTLSWEAAVDPDQDVVTYGIMVGDGLMNSIAFGDTTGTSISIPFQAIYAVLHAVPLTTVSGEWAIFATDGIDTTWAENGPFMLTIDASTVSIDNTQIPDVYALHQNYPNPFNPTTTIQYDLPEAADVTLVVYNMLGQRVATLVNSHQNAGYYNLRWNGLTNVGTPIASGIYLYRIQAGQYTKTMKMMYMK